MPRALRALEGDKLSAARIAQLASPRRAHTPPRHGEQEVGISFWPPAKTSTWRPTGTLHGHGHGDPVSIRFEGRRRRRPRRPASSRVPRAHRHAAYGRTPATGKRSVTRGEMMCRCTGSTRQFVRPGMRRCPVGLGAGPLTRSRGGDGLRQVVGEGAGLEPVDEVALQLRGSFEPQTARTDSLRVGGAA